MPMPSSRTTRLKSRRLKNDEGDGTRVLCWWMKRMLSVRCARWAVALIG